MFMQMLQECTGSFAVERELAELRATEHLDSPHRAPADACGGVVIMQTAGPGMSECFVINRRESYWTMVGVKADSRLVA